MERYVYLRFVNSACWSSKKWTFPSSLSSCQNIACSRHDMAKKHAHLVLNNHLSHALKISRFYKKKIMLHHDKQILLVVGDVFVKTVSDCCITPNEHFFQLQYIMARTSYIRWDDDDDLYLTNTLIGFWIFIMLAHVLG